METERQVTIYALCDPGTNEVRYIGQSVDPNTRIKAHIGTSFTGKTKRDNWIRSLLINGKTPILKILSIVDVAEADDSEVKAIKQAKRDGCKLVNGTESPNGGSIRARPRHEKIKMTFSISRRTAEQIERLAAGEYGSKDFVLSIAIDRLTR